MRKLLYLAFIVFMAGLFAPTHANAQVDSTCQVFGTGGTLSIQNGTVKRFYTKYIAGAIYGWSVIGANAVIVGPRNQHYVDIQGVACGPITICVSYSVDGQSPCCVCVPAEVIGCGGGDPPSCCIRYVNATMQPPWIKIKFQACSPGITSAKLFRWDGSQYVLLDTDANGSGYNPTYTYNLDIMNFSCNEIYCLRICGYKADGTECCTSRFAIRVDCDPTNTYFTGVTDITYPGCNSPGGGGGLPVDKTVSTKQKLNLSPNPVSSMLLVSFPEKNNIHSLQVVDRNGNIIKTFAVTNSNSFTIPVSNLKTGDYIIKTDDPLVESAVFIKQ